MKNYIDKKLFFILMGYVIAYKIVIILRVILFWFYEEKSFKNIELLTIIIRELTGAIFIVAPIVCLILFLTKIMIGYNYKWSYIIIIHFMMSWIYGFFISLFGEIYIAISKADITSFSGDKIIYNLIYFSSRDFLGYVGFVSIIYSYYYINRSTKMELQKAYLSQQLLTMKMEALKSQLNPHFLFNTLNSISALIKEDQKKAQDMIMYLGDLLRELLILKDENLITVDKELTILNKYLDIMKIRFSDHLSIDISIEKEIENVLIPTMIIQPIIENSLKHGYSYDVTNLKVQLNISKRENSLRLHIVNNGKALDSQKPSNGMGLKNIKDRLQTLYDANFDFILSSIPNNKGVETIITLPIV
ncbi:sensor histidine kinase [Aquimarina algiphila]|uniref:sensor histidine kinase n=1 Tax=Aquimarina algiphila TaxID=2047982 RepID=UPI002492DDA5|nr:histidine kinase [Aquimarina algiphila]